MIVIDQEDELTVLDHCNECGVLIPVYNELCYSCGLEELAREQDEALEDPNAGCWSYSW